MTTDRDRPLDEAAAEVNAHGRVEYMFATPIFSHTFREAAALNTRLRERILERERTTPSASKSNQGGWQSVPDFFDWPDPAVSTLEGMIGHALNAANAHVPLPPDLAIEFELFGWAAVNRHGHYNTAHLHPQSTWSGVYYVDAGDEPAEGPAALLEFNHPISGALMDFFPGILPSARTVRPETGMMIVFPSYLLHSVRMYHGTRPRICVAFNAHLRSVRK
jgi:uncharacterized protein (TIGR02466 family)